ncbi:PLDc N-terminal domain-containing protein [Agromyces subbeticus]|uniref:PLDc N-terminal domain-containing protein n=1 Tax=Agromyces subbeticus TaxID=293890 RepID=UPI0004102FB3|nr:PLDc N-terminal domain-containing protein [Agromyces subbeticus]
MDGFFGWHLVGLLIGVAYLAIIIWVISRIFRTNELNELERWVWAIAVFCFPLVGSIVWFAAGPHPFGIRISRDLR